MLQQSNSKLRLCIVVVVVMLLQLSPVLSQDVKIGTQTWTSKNLDVSNTSCLASSTYSVYVVNQEIKKPKTNIYMH